MKMLMNAFLIVLAFLVVSTSVHAGVPWTEIGQALVIKPNGTMFNATRFGIFCSTDNGASWRFLDNSILSVDDYLWKLVVSPNGNLFAGTRSHGIYRSSDDGEHWTQIGLSGLFVSDMVIDAHGHIFAGTISNGIYRSTDEGTTWKRSHFVRTKNKIVSSIAVSKSGAIFYALYPGSVYRSVDDGNTWRPMVLRRATANEWFLGVGSQGEVLAGHAAHGIFRTVNDGRGWKKIAGSGFNVFSLAGAPNGDFFAGVASIYHFTQSQTGWTSTQVLPGLSGPVVQIVIPSSTAIFALTDRNGLYKSTDNGITWVHIDMGYANSPVSSTPQNRFDELKIYPISFSLEQNYPNPFNPSTVISYSLSAPSLVTLKVYNTLGQEVAELIHNELMDEGEQEVEFDASRLASGVYYYTIIATDVEGKNILFSNSKKMILIR